MRISRVSVAAWTSLSAVGIAARPAMNPESQACCSRVNGASTGMKGALMRDLRRSPPDRPQPPMVADASRSRPARARCRPWRPSRGSRRCRPTPAGGGSSRSGT
ncbi:hypothetical protein ACFPRL_01755 [Pseudoclavibacter helvolus]